MFKVRQVIFKPHHGFHIQVIGRFVQQQIVRITVKRLRQHHAYLFLTAQFTHQCIVLVFLHSQATEQHGGVTFGIPTVKFRKFLLQFGHFQTVLIGKVFFGIQYFALFHNIPQYGMPHHHCIHHRKSIPFEVVLAQYRKAFARA